MFPRALSYLACVALLAQQGQACTAPAMLVFDGSASMAELSTDFTARTRIEEARIAVAQALPQITPFRQVGLLVYGPGGQDGCAGIDLRFPPALDTAAQIVGAVEALRPGGLTPLAASVQRAAEVLRAQSTGGAGGGVIVLVTDGNETCGGTPCALGDQLAQRAGEDMASDLPGDITVHVIGFRVAVDFFSWNSPEAGAYGDGTTVAKCLADKTGGLYVSTETVAQLVAALNQTLGCALIGRWDAAPAARGPHAGDRAG